MRRKLEILKEVRKAYRKTKRPIWKTVCEILESSRRRERAVNVSKLDKLVPNGAYVVVPGKVLGFGLISKKVTVGALDFSASAMEKIKKAGGKALYLDKFAKKYSKKGGLILIGG